MEEFLKEYNSIITHSVEIIAAVTGLILYRKYKFTAAKFFIWFLCYALFCDYIGKYTSFMDEGEIFNFLKGSFLEKNYCIYTLLWFTGAVLFYVFYFSKVLKKDRDRKIAKYTGVVFLLFSIVNIFFNFQDFFIKSLPFINISGSLVIVICVVMYYIQILQSDKILTFYKSLNFYISTAIFFWWLIIPPLGFYDIYFGVQDMNYVNLRTLIYLITNVFMYSMFTFGLIFSKPDDD